MSIAPSDTYTVPLPVSDDYSFEHAVLGEGDPDTVAMYGHCADFCEARDSQQVSGLTVSEHGRWCSSMHLLVVNGVDPQGSPASLWTEVVRPYMHGTYLKDDATARVARGKAESVRLTLLAADLPSNQDRGDEGWALDLSLGDARRLAAALTRAVDVADRLDRNYNNARRERARG